MTTLISTPSLAQNPSETAPTPGSVTLDGVPWDLYQQLRDLPDNDHKRMIYNHGTLVIMSPTSLHHEWLSAVLNLLILDWADARNISIENSGSTTFQRGDLERALEPDQSYYVSHAANIRGAKKVDLSTDPPPDLALEVDVTSPSDIKLPVYAAIEVPEVWIWKADRLRPLVLRDGEYVEAQESTQLPGFPLTDASRIILTHWPAGQQAVRREFQAFVRQM